MMWNHFRTLSVSVLLLSISSIVILSSISNLSANAEVITLTTETFSDKVLVTLSRSSCNMGRLRCRRKIQRGSLSSACLGASTAKIWGHYGGFGKEMEGEDEVEIGEVDCATNKPVCSKVDIHSYPTFKLFYNGEEVSKYQVEIQRKLNKKSVDYVQDEMDDHSSVYHGNFDTVTSCKKVMLMVPQKEFIRTGKTTKP
ncbi:protein disulfide-isomerase 5-1 [Sesamum angolense]|uniref:Protein disulfide-isomerase 5-1 n=1 Tax=Sesamum angolense TaxID=2727404 RepID=A0AAE1XCI0_9LAMI|nr:protein disulfide-isomerase 5-1 [Sesamum angolense]